MIARIAVYRTLVSASVVSLALVAQASGFGTEFRVTSHITLVSGNIKAFDFGTCEEPED